MLLIAMLPTPSSKPPPIAEIWPVLLVLVGVVLVGFVAIGIIRKWMRGDDVGTEVGFTLSDLRRLNREGRLSDEELARAEEQMITRVRAMASESDVHELRPKTEGQGPRNRGNSPEKRRNDREI